MFVILHGATVCNCSRVFNTVVCLLLFFKCMDICACDIGEQQYESELSVI